MTLDIGPRVGPRHIAAMAERSRLTDTAPWALAVQFGLYRRMTSAEKARRVQELTITANALSLAGLKQRYPDADRSTLLRRLAVLRLGAETVRRAYGSGTPGDGP